MSEPHEQSALERLSYAGKTVLITGSTDGLGREIARGLAEAGAHVILHGRDAERGEALVEEIGYLAKGSASFHRADFASLTAVREFADMGAMPALMFVHCRY